MRQRKVIHSYLGRPRAAIVLLLGLLVAFGGYLRLADLGQPSLWIDEGYSLNAAEAIRAHGYPLLDSGAVYDDWLLPDYLIAGSIALFGSDPFSPWAARLPSAIIGTALIVAVFLLAQVLFPATPVPFIAAFLTAFSQWEIAWSGQARGYAAASLFVTLMLWCAWRFLEARRPRVLIGGGAAAAGAYFSTPLSLLVLPGVAFFWLADAVARQRLIERLGLLRFSLALAGLFALALAFFEFALDTTRLSAGIAPAPYLRFLSHDLGVFSLGALAGAALGFFDAKRARPVLFVSLSLFAAVLFAVLYSPAVQMRYLFPFFPLALMLGAYAAFRTSELIASALALRARFAAACGGAFVIAVALAFPSLQFLPSASRALEYDSPQPDFAAAYSIIKERLAENGCPEAGSDCPAIVSPYAQLTSLYLGEKGLTLPMSLTGNPQELARRLARGSDYYTGAPLIMDDAQLSALLENGRGFVVLDRMALIRLPEQAALIENAPHSRALYRSGSGLDEIRLYEFNYPDSP